MKRLILIFSLLVNAILANAQLRSFDEAKSLATSFQSSRLDKKVSVTAIDDSKSRKLCKAGDADAPAFYIFNDTENNSFVIISAATSMQPVLAYADSGVFDADNCPPGLLDVLQRYRDAYDVCKSINIPAAPSRSGKSPVSPMLKTKWGQTFPFNEQCPRTNRGDATVAGCMAIAVAQVMNYYKYPAVGHGEIAYRPYGSDEHIDLSEYAFDWANICDDYDENSSQVQIDAVSRLVKAVGYSLLTNYGYYGSGSTFGNDTYALKHYFNYNPNMLTAHRTYYTDDEWLAMIDEEIDNQRPIIVDAGTYSWGYKCRNIEGHAFVLDGRDAEGYYHFNFGWYGDYDGYYLIDAITPQEFNFDVLQTMVVGIYPDTLGSEPDDFYSDQFVIKYNKDENKLYSYVETTCWSNNAQSPGYDQIYKDIVDRIDADYYIGIFDKDFCLIDTLYYWENRPRYCLLSYKIDESYDFDISKYNEGDQFYITQVTRTKGNDRLAIPRARRYSHSRWYLATVVDGSLELSPEGIIGAPDNLTLDDFVHKVHIPEAGQLSSLINDNVKSARKLIVSGDMNGDDIVALRDILDKYNVNSLDLSNCRIVEGGESYAQLTSSGSKRYTKNDVLGQFTIFETQYLEYLRLPSTINEISGWAVYGNSRLKTVDIPEGCQIINQRSFVNNTHLKTITIPATVESLPHELVENCPKMESLIISEDSPYFKNVDEVIFSKDMLRLHSFPIWNKAEVYEIPFGVKEIGEHAFAGHTFLRSIAIPETVTLIEGDAFKYCDSLESLVFPPNLQVIPRYVCFDCGKLESITLPKHINQIEYCAFSCCRALHHITSHIPDMSKVSVGKDAFNKIPADCKWTVGYGCAPTYTSCPWWVDTWIIEEEDIDGISDIEADNAIRAVYDLNGIKRATLDHATPITGSSLGIPAGVYIVDGKKTFIGE